MSDKTGRRYRFWLVVGAAILGLVLLLQSATFKVFLDRVVHWAEAVMNTHPVWGGVVFLLFSALSAMLAFTSTVVLVPPASQAWGNFVTFFLLWGGWTLGAIAAFGIGRSAGPLLMRLGYKEKLEKYQEYVSTRMKFWMVLIFCLAVPSEIPGYLFGWMKYPFRRFIVAIGIAEAIYAVGVIVAGEKLLKAETGPLVLILTAMAAVAGVAGYALRRIKRQSDGTSPPGKP
jgi:uncharacterized membrane protein YdjX (TVP38/TMEM64 family)